MRLSQLVINMNKTYYETLSSYRDRKITTVTYLEGARTGEKEIYCDDFKPENVSAGVVETPQGKVYIEHLSQPPVCVICGAGHVGIPVIKLAKLAGFQVVVMEDRPSFADQARNAGADRVICAAFEKALAEISGGQQTYFVVMTRGHRYDEECLTKILKKPYAYVGMMASRGRAARMKQNLLKTGFPAEKLDEIHMPIGLSIHAKTPEEIAISVLAEMIEVKNSAGDTISCDQEILENIVKKDSGEPWVLATIIRRSGSAPREVGTKMLLTDTGMTVGSIGGGCMEAEVLREARIFLKKEQREPIEIITADMSGAEAEDAGMVCGGRIEVLLEVVS